MIPANIKGALILSLGYLAMIAAAIIITFYARKAKEERQNKPSDPYDLVGRISDSIFKDLFRK